MFDYISIFFLKHTLKMSAKCAQQSMIFNIPDLLCPKPLIITIVTWLFTSLYQQTFRKIHYTNWSDYPHFKKMSLYASVCNNMVAMWPLFSELIVSFCMKITQGKFQGISFWLQCGHPENDYWSFSKVLKINFTCNKKPLVTDERTSGKIFSRPWWFIEWK